VTGDGQRIDCDFAVLGVGVQPNVELAVRAGLDVENGVLVDEWCRTNAPNVLAAGDVASFPLAGQHVRVEHFQHAVKHGRAAGLSAAGLGEPFVEVPWFWSEQYDERLEYSGYHRTWDGFVLRGWLEDRSFLGFYCEAGTVRAIVSFNRSQELRRVTPAIGREVPPEALRDASVDLRELAATA
jgi:3-phenylpropionate/trans-cinnamate dioxygenase ferredoxin reductase subunit